MKKSSASPSVFLPFHIGSKNRGCEAITKATAILLGIKREKVYVLTDNKYEDRKTGLQKFVTIEEGRSNKNTFNTIFKLSQLMGRKYGIDICQLLKYYCFLQKAHRGDIVLISGGDLYCYPEMICKLKWVVFMSRIRGCRLILWGCSIEKNVLNKSIIKHIKKYDAIYVRENLSRQNLINYGIRDVKLISDPAFMLEPISCDLPTGIGNSQVVGINISNYVNSGGYSTNTLFFQSIINLVGYILSSTEMKILLIPHVFWKGQDDRVLARILYKRFKETGRVFLLESEKLSYSQIRYVISKCYTFVGARTHSVISAYSMGIPSLALGYSVKSKGIASDLKLSDHLVIDCNELKDIKEILSHYQYLEKNYMEIKRLLQQNITEYISGNKNINIF